MRRILIVLAVALGAGTAHAQPSYPTSARGPSNEALASPGAVMEYIGTDGLVHPCSALVTPPAGLCGGGGGGGSGGGGITVTRSAPTTLSVAVGTSVTTILAAGTYSRIGYQVQGSGSGCIAFGPAVPVIAGNFCSNSAVIASGSVDVRKAGDGAMPSTALYAIGEAGSNLTVTYEVQ